MGVNLHLKYSINQVEQYQILDLLIILEFQVILGGEIKSVKDPEI